jgi:hypothetical protein
MQSGELTLLSDMPEILAGIDVHGSRFGAAVFPRDVLVPITLQPAG